MIQTLKKLLSKSVLLLPFDAMLRPLMFIRSTEKFDVVQRVPLYTRIKF
jgi:hypothetical protein